MFCFFLFLDRLSAKMVAPNGTGQTGSWNLVVLPPDQVPDSATPAQSSRIPKMLSHRAFGKARFLLYMDSKKNVWPWVTADSLASWVLLQIRPYPASTPYAWVGAEHPDRFTAYEEALEVCFRGVAGEQCVEQMMGYHRRGFPIDFGIPLLEGGWHLRDLRRPESSEVGCHWMQEFLSWDQPRDQLSWNFAVWSSRLTLAKKTNKQTTEHLLFLQALKETNGLTHPIFLFSALLKRLFFSQFESSQTFHAKGACGPPGRRHPAGDRARAREASPKGDPVLTLRGAFALGTRLPREAELLSLVSKSERLAT